MKSRFSLMSIFIFIALLLPQLAFADIAPMPEDDKDSSDDSACSASPLTAETPNWSVLLVIMASVGAISFAAISRTGKKQGNNE